MLEKLFNWSKKKPGEESESSIAFGRYSDNNKSLEKIAKWNESEALFKEKKYAESIEAFFDYLRDEETDNVVFTKEGYGGTFHFYQGSKIIRGFYNNEKIEAETGLARMATPSVPVMRKLLEMNFNLYYSRYAIHKEVISILFDSDIETANPSKLYYGFKELATKADKQDDLLLADFTTLQPVDIEHIIPIPDEEKAVKHEYLKKWIQETIELAESIDSDKYSGGVAYLLLALAYRIDYLLVPDGKLLLEIEKIVEIYFRKDDRLVTQKNIDMMECLQKLAAKDKEEIYPYLSRSKFTFSIVTPQNYKSIADAIYNANQNIAWYKENKFPRVAAKISEYGFSYCQYSYSLPRPVSQLFHLFMMINYPDFFNALGIKDDLFQPQINEYNKEKILQRIENIVAKWQGKYPELKFNAEKLKYDNPVAFNQTFTTEIEYLNLETR